MNEQEVIKDLRGRVKPYIGVMPQSVFSNNITRFQAGLLKPGTLALFFNKLGYVKEDGLWKKIN